MNIVEKKLTEIKPYEKNPRRNDGAVDAVANSIREFGFKVPVVIDNDGVIVCGHTRYKAAKKLKMKTVPCVIADDLTDEQIKAYRLADNKVGELAEWDFAELADELENIFDIDMTGFGFDDFSFELSDYDEPAPDDNEEYERKKKEFQERMASGELSEDDEEYQEFLNKFEAKKTTDDCYTPPLVYEAVENWVAEEYGLNKNNFVRPFYPGGDYQNFDYKKTDIVVDNPPFSIISEICRYYQERGIKYFMFAPHLTICGIRTAHKVIVGASVVYENKANVNTSFVTNLDKYEIRSAPKLYKAIKQAVEQTAAENKKELPKYSYPNEVVTASELVPLSRYGFEFGVLPEECCRISELEAQKKVGKGIFGSGYLIAEKAAAEKAAAEKAAAEKAAAEKAAATKWELSDREREIIKKLGGGT